MPPYRHHDKAGNFADVHKHWLLSLILTQQREKSNPLTYLETHAGSGMYRLDNSPDAAQGIGKLNSTTASLPRGLSRYLQLVRSLNPLPSLQRYPGSPLIARHFLQPQDMAVLFDNQPAVMHELTLQLGHDERFKLCLEDGFQGGATLRPTTASTVLLIDPPYEDGDDIAWVSQLLQSLLLQTAPPQIAVWYPLLEGTHCWPEAGAASLWRSELFPEGREGKRMHGSGMMLINVPEQLLLQAEQEGRYLTRLLQAKIDYWRPS